MSALPLLIRLRLRRDRVQLVIWLAVFAVFALFVVQVLRTSYGTQVERVEVLRLSTLTPSILALRGAPAGTSLGAFAAFETLAYFGLLVAFLNTFLAVRHGRAEEDTGRAELVGSTRAGRIAPLVATIVTGLAVDVAVGAVTAAGLAAAGLPAGGSVVYGAALSCCGIAFLGVGLLAGAAFSSGRAANGWSAAVVGVAFLLRAVGDASGARGSDGLTVTAAWPSWLSPIGWAQLSQPYVADRPGPLILALAFGAVLIAATLALQGVRDLGQGVVAARPGRADASPALRGPIGLAWRLQRGSLIGWGVGAVAMGAIGGQLGPAAVAQLSSDRSVAATVRALVPGGSGTILEVFIAAIAAITGLIVAGALVQLIMRLRQEEALGTAETVLAGRTGRIRWLLSFLVVGGCAALAMLLLAGLAAAGASASAGRPQDAGRWLAAMLVQAPGAVVYATVLAVVLAVLPRVTIGVGWGFFTAGALLGEFGGLLKLPHWLRQVSPQSHVPAIPTSDVHWAGFWWLVVVCVVGVALAAALLRRRDVVGQ